VRAGHRLRLEGDSALSVCLEDALSGGEDVQAEDRTLFREVHHVDGLDPRREHEIRREIRERSILLGAREPTGSEDDADVEIAVVPRAARGHRAEPIRCRDLGPARDDRRDARTESLFVDRERVQDPTSLAGHGEGHLTPCIILRSRAESTKRINDETPDMTTKSMKNW